jgi:hypothetical protein
MEQPNVIAVIVAAVIPMVVGMLWYSPVLFAKKWMALIGKTEEEIKKEGPGKAYALSFIASIVMAYVMAHLVTYSSTFTGSTGIAAGLETGFWSWLGFVVTTNSASVLFEFKPRGLYFINMGYQLVSMLLMGALLGVWR